MRCVQPTPFFAIPFGFAKLEPAQPLNDELADLFRQRAAEGTRYANPRPLTQRNGQVFESEFQLFKWPDPCIRQLKEFCWQHLMQFGFDQGSITLKLDHPDVKSLTIPISGADLSKE